MDRMKANAIINTLRSTNSFNKEAGVSNFTKSIYKGVNNNIKRLVEYLKSSKSGGIYSEGALPTSGNIYRKETLRGVQPSEALLSPRDLEFKRLADLKTGAAKRLKRNLAVGTAGAIGATGYGAGVLGSVLGNKLYQDNDNIDNLYNKLITRGL